MVVFLLNITLVYSYCIKSSNIFPVFIDVSSLLKNLISASSSFFRFSPLILTVAKEQQRRLSRDTSLIPIIRELYDEIVDITNNNARRLFFKEA